MKAKLQPLSEVDSWGVSEWMAEPVAGVRKASGPVPRFLLG